MEFCSEYGYDYGFNGSESEEYSDEDEKSKKKIKRKIRKADTNIIAVKFDELVAPNLMFAGEPKMCTVCTAFMSVESKKNIEKTDGKILWKCEFCDELNDMSKLIENVDEIPKSGDVTFMIEPPKPIQDKSDLTKNLDVASKVTSTDDTHLSFCIDISGSMNTAIKVKKDEEMTNEVISRLNGVKAACIQNLKTLKETTPEKRVSLITFSDTVKYYGDTMVKGSDPIVSFQGGEFSGSHLNNSFSRTRFSITSANQMQNHSTNLNRTKSFKDKIKSLFNRRSSARTSLNQETNINNIAEAQVEEPQPNLNEKEQILNLANNTDGNLKSIKKTYANLENIIKSLCTEGSTALGPALLFSIGFASKKSGSSVILCTDGCANVGIGSMEYGNNAEKFYDELADYAKEKGVSVNVISMEGTDCKLALLGRVADRSNGTLSIVNPSNLGDEFKSILANRIVATNVQAKLIVNNKYLYIRDDKLEAEESKAIETDDAKAKEALHSKRKSIIVKDIGNANIDTEITFEYGFRKLDKNDEVPKSITELPFQLQITYTTSDGMKAVRVYTQKQNFTTDRTKAESNLRSKEVMFLNATQNMCNQMTQSNVSAAQYRSYGIDQMLVRNCYIAPEKYNHKSKIVMKMSKSKKATEYCDEVANEMFSAKQMNRSKMNEKK